MSYHLNNLKFGAEINEILKKNEKTICLMIENWMNK